MPIPNFFLTYSTTVASSQVLAWRGPMLALMMINPTALRQREAMRMVTEKQAAIISGILSAQAAIARGCWSWWSSPYVLPTGSPPVFGIAQSFLAPGHRAAKANARRLRNRKRM